MGEDKGSKDSSPEDIFDEFQSYLEQFPVLRDLIDEIEKGRLEGDYRFRLIEDGNFDGFDIRLKIRMPVQKSIKLRDFPKPQKVYPLEILEKAKEVEIAERVVDDIYRALAIKVLSSKLDIPVLLLLRDVLQLLENSADKAQDAADAARMLSFIM